MTFILSYVVGAIRFFYEVPLRCGCFEALKQKVDAEIKRIVDEQYQRGMTLLRVACLKKVSNMLWKQQEYADKAGQHVPLGHTGQNPDGGGEGLWQSPQSTTRIWAVPLYHALPRLLCGRHS